MKIVQIGIRCQGGGAEEVAKTLHDEFRLEGESAFWIVMENEPDSDSCQSLYLEGRSPLKIVRAAMKLRKLLLELAPDIALIHCELPQFLISSISWPKGMKVFLVEHQPFMWKGLRGFLLRVVHKILQRRKIFWVHLRKSRLPKDLRNHFFIPNPVKVDSRLLQTFPKATAEKVRLIFIGRLSAEKGYEQLLRSLSVVGASELEVFGEGNLKGIEVDYPMVNVRHHGFVHDLWQQINQSCIVLINSTWEGDGLVILQALAYQIPLLIKSFPDLEELPVSQDSICNNSQGFEQKLREVLSLDQTSRVQLLTNPNATHIILSERAPNLVAKRYIEIFERVWE